MSGSAGVLEFFIVEANEYIDRLDALIGAAGAAGPELDPFVRPARALRGSATMARQYGIAELAAALERGARALRDGRTRWESARPAFVATIDDLRVLIRNVRSWSPDDDRRVQVRSAELERLAPTTIQSAPTPVRSGDGVAYLA